MGKPTETRCKNMKELVVISGKGGTGKTSITAAIAMLAANNILVDCDVDAANLHLITGSNVLDKQEFMAGFEAEIDCERCKKCGRCINFCKFEAISEKFIINKLHCEGCGVCTFQCPHQAISLKNKHAGHWFISQTRFGKLVHAKLGLAVENSGKLVSQVRNQAKKLAEAENNQLIITDGPPGVGCPAIAAVTGADLVLSVVEPSVSGMHDLERVVKLTNHFGLQLLVCINKATLNKENTQNLIKWCEEKNIEVVGEIPYSDKFNQALRARKTILEIENAELKQGIVSMWENISKKLNSF